MEHVQGPGPSYKQSGREKGIELEEVVAVEEKKEKVKEEEEKKLSPPQFYMRVLKHIEDGDLESIKRLLNYDRDPSASLNGAVNPNNDTVLHLAVLKGAPIKFIRNLVSLMDETHLESLNNGRFTVLHYAAMVGYTEAAEVIFRKNPSLTKLRDRDDRTPLELAALFAHKNIVWLHFPETILEDPISFAGERGVSLLSYLIIAEFYDIAIYLLKSCHSLAIQKDDKGCPALFYLAKKPHSFLSGNQFNFLQSMLYKCTYYVECVNMHGKKDVENPAADPEYPTYGPRKSQRKFKFLQHTLDAKMMHVQALQLAKILCEEIAKADTFEVNDLLRDPILIAAQVGIHELIWEIVKTFPDALRCRDEDHRSVFALAVLNRKEKVYNLIYEMSSEKHVLMASMDNFGNTMLHLAGELGPSDRISGSALHMQRELQWFKEIENAVQPSYKLQKNDAGKTPRELFTEKHKDLVKQGEKWMKSTATSCTVVAALVITAVFAASFTLPGGNNSDGYPIFLNRLSFLIFSVSNALALFSASTSVLMFLGILTSRYSEEDFLRALPMRLCIALVTLFLSIAFMLAAFGSALHIVLVHRLSWVAAPIIALACVPLTLFVFLQFPLLFEMVSSTFGPSIFHPQGKETLF